MGISMQNYLGMHEELDGCCIRRRMELNWIDFLWIYGVLKGLFCSAEQSMMTCNAMREGGSTKQPPDNLVGLSSVDCSSWYPVLNSLWRKKHPRGP